MKRLVINDDPNKLVEATMHGPVGARCQNNQQDTKLVQSLLNAIPTSEGGPQAKLKVDGVCGPLTVAAARRYQTGRVKVVDGRVDPAGPTLTSLMTVLHARNAVPKGVAGIGPTTPDVHRALTARTPQPMYSRADLQDGSAAMSAQTAAFKPALITSKAPQDTPGAMNAKSGSQTSSSQSSLYIGPMGWSFSTSSGFDVTGPMVGVTVINIQMTHDSEPGLVYTFRFAGAWGVPE